jgi:hypothetical protein
MAFELYLSYISLTTNTKVALRGGCKYQHQYDLARGTWVLQSSDKAGCYIRRCYKTPPQEATHNTQQTKHAALISQIKKHAGSSEISAR